MSEWFSEFYGNLLEFTPALWIALVVLAASGAALAAHLRRGQPKPAVVWGLSLVMAASVVLTAAFLPTIVPEEGDASILYSAWFWAVCLVALLGVLIALMLRRQVWTAKMMATGALCVAMAALLSALKLFTMPQGGSVTPASMLPILLFAWIYGMPAGCAAGLVYGVLQLTLGAYIIHPMQFLLDYILPFTVLGLAGLFRGQSAKALPAAIWAGGTVRFIIHVLSGVLYFASYAPEGQSPLVYSMLYNGSYMLPELVICTAIVLIPQIATLLSRLKRQAVITAQT